MKRKARKEVRKPVNRRGFLLGVLALTAETTLLRLSGIWMKGYIAARLGSVQLGVYQLLCAVFAFGVVLSASGASFVCTRLTAEHGPNRKTLLRCIALSLAVSGGAAVLLWLLAPGLGELLGEGLPLRILAVGLPFLSVCACLKGTFLAQGKTLAPMGAELFEQGIGILLSLWLLTRIPSPLCALALASTLSEIASCLWMFFAWMHRFGRVCQGPPVPWREAVRVGGPVLAGAGLRSALSTLDSLLIPQSLRALSGAAAAMASYGLLQGMVLPLLQFPAGLLSSATTLLIPELARSSAAGKRLRIQRISGRAFRLTLCFSFAAAAATAVFAGSLCRLFYGNEEAAWLLRVLAPLIPLQYADSVVDGMLKGLDQQSFTLCCNLADAAARVVWCIFVVPRLGLFGYVLLLFFSEIGNAAFSITRLLRVSRAEVSPLWVLLPAGACIGLFWLCI